MNYRFSGHETFPCRYAWLPKAYRSLTANPRIFGNEEDAIVSHGALIQQRLNTPDQPGFWNTYNMPVTRTMSPAKIKLLLAFIAQEMQAAAKTP